MLTELRIQNFAIIQNLELEFGSSLVTFTGETGAGKSILLDAIEAVIGGKADSSQIRSGAERAIVEATFSLSDSNQSAIQDILKREEMLDDSSQLTLTRELRREGRSIARAGGRSISVGLLRELGSYLVDIHGQSEHLSLLNIRQHLGLLDRYANTDQPLSSYRNTYHHWAEARRELIALRQDEQDAVRRADFLTFQVQEIETARLTPGEDEELRHERDRLSNAENLAALSQQCVQLLEEGSPEIPAISDQLGEVLQALASLSRMDSSQSRLYEQVQLLIEMVGDLSREIHDYQEKIEYNPRRLEQVQERLDLIHRLKRKYGGSIEAVLVYAKDARQKLERITHAGERIEVLEAELKNSLEKLAEEGALLSRQRKQAAENLGKAVECELVDLSMGGARFSVDLHVEPKAGGLNVEGQEVAFDDTGLDRVEFLIAPNPGEGFKPLVKIASGGETSRLMLALKNVLSQADAIPTLIFDEIDQGIGGRVGMVVGEKLWNLARIHQVFCVTHLPQLAAFGDQHFGVRKHMEEGRTLTYVESLEGSSRLDELAQMLGSLSEANRRVAQETLEMARQRTGGQAS